MWLVLSGPFAAGTPYTSVGTAAATALAQVTRGTLSARTMENGTLGYAGDYQVVNKAGGTITGLPSVGKVIGQGKVFYRVDGKPVVLLRGDVPVYRGLSWGAQGRRAAVEHRAGEARKCHRRPDRPWLRPLWQAYYAVKELQDAVGLAKTGSLALGQAVFVPAGRIRITEVVAVPGGMAAAGSGVLRASSTAREVTVALNASRGPVLAPRKRPTRWRRCCACRAGPGRQAAGQ